ncbi:hypothetical protein KJ693_06805 [bacterium]|nr:hypothetical protein [bacterium]
MQPQERILWEYIFRLYNVNSFPALREKLKVIAGEIAATKTYQNKLKLSL